MRLIALNPSSASQRVNSPILIGFLSSSPVGSLWVALSPLGVVAVDWNQSELDFIKSLNNRFHTHVRYEKSRTDEPLRQIAEYLNGTRRQFNLSIDLSDTSPFQFRVLQLTSEIPYGLTTTYKAIATRLGNPHAARAVGRVEATNPIPLIIPCHRVVGSDGNLHGYGGPGGINLKAWLLELEQSR